MIQGSKTKYSIYCFPVRNAEKARALIGCCPVQFFMIRTAHVNTAIRILAWRVYFASEDAKVWVKSILTQRPTATVLSATPSRFLFESQAVGPSDRLPPCHMCASKPCVEARTIARTIANEDLENVRQWLFANKLSLNLTKTEYILIASNFKILQLGNEQQIHIGDMPVKRVDSNALGIYIDDQLTWSTHIDYT